MNRIFYIILFLSITLNSGVLAQENNRVATPSKIYSDRITDQDGIPLSGIKIRVRGQATSTFTDVNGEFSINAKNGDVIILSKNGKIINSYQLDGSVYYEINDESGQMERQELKKTNSISKFKSRRKDNTIQFQQLLDSASNFNKKNPIKSIDYIRSALLIADDNNNKSQLAQSYSVLGDVYMNLKQYDLAVGNYKTAFDNTENTAVQLKLAHAYLLNNEFKNSESQFKKISIKKDVSLVQKIEINEGLGDIYRAQRQYESALSQYETALKFAKNQQNSSQIANLNAKISSVLEASGQLSKAEGYLIQSQNNAKSDSPKKAVIKSRRAAEFYSRNKNVDKEVQLREETLNNLEEVESDEIVVEDNGDALTKPKAKLDLGNALLKQNNFGKAIPILEESAAEAEIADDIITQKNAVQRLSEVYASIGDDDKALSNYKKYVSLVDRLYQQKEEEIKAIVNLNRDLSEKQNRITSLEKDRELSQSKYQLYQTEGRLTLENDRRQKLIIYALLVGLALLLFSLFWMLRSNKQRRLANNLLALKSLRTQMNPHFIFNALNSVNSFIAQNDERTANRYLTDFSTLMRSVLNNSEEDFIPLEKEIELLELYLKLEHSRFKDKFDYDLTVDKNIDQGQFQIPPMLLQPYVENAVWHGLRYKKEKGFLKVQLFKIDEVTIQIEISDNGIGRKKSKELKTDHQKKQQSKGMQNIKQRVAILNEMYKDKVDVFINDLYDDATGTKVVLTLKKD